MDRWREYFEGLLEKAKIDTHEHFLPLEEENHEEDPLFGILKNSYLPWILFGARDLKRTEYDRHELLRGMKRIPASGFYRYIVRALRFMYGIEDTEITESNWDVFSEAVADAHSKDVDLMEYWLFDKLRVEKAVLDRYWVVGDYQVDRRRFAAVFRIDPYFFGYSSGAKDHDGNSPYGPGEKKGEEIVTFADYLELVERRIKKGLTEGVVAFKCAIAYDRSLDFSLPSRQAAERAFYQEEGQEDSEGILDFQNFLFHHFMRKAAEVDLPVQIHTGPGKAFQSAASRLGPIFEMYSSVKISLFHGSFPWVGEPGAMSLFYPNLNIDLVWLPIMSPSFGEMALTQWLETTGGQRIMMGGDSWNVEGAVGSILENLEVISRVLARLERKGYLSKSTAWQIAQMILWDNPREFFGDRLKIQ